MKKTIDWVLRLACAGILGQTLFFKFTAAPESVYIFSTLGIEPWGRIAAGVLELVAAALLLAPSTVVYGALLSCAVMSGAIVGHLTQLGITLPAVGDNGELFGLAVIVFVCSSALAWLRRDELLARGRSSAPAH
jgi:hypothetical protein